MEKVNTQPFSFKPAFAPPYEQQDKGKWRPPVRRGAALALADFFLSERCGEAPQ